MSKLQISQSVENMLDGILNELTCKEPLSKEILRESLREVLIFDRKQQDYGSSNISAFQEVGVVVRMTDKMSRLKNLIGIRRKAPRNESILDTYDDLAVYAKIAKLCHTGKWPR